MYSSLTHTGTSSTVQGETLSTLAAERALGVHTPAICTHAREHLTLINVYRDTDIFRTSQGETHTNTDAFFSKAIYRESIEAHNKDKKRE